MNRTQTATLSRSITWLLTAATAAAGLLLGALLWAPSANAQEGSGAESSIDEGTGSDDGDTKQCEGKAHGRFGASVRGDKGAELAELLGIEADAMREALHSGSSLADLAEENGVDIQTLIDAITESIEERIAAAEAAGRIDADRAAELSAGAADKAAEIVNNVKPERGEGHNFGKRGGARHGAKAGPAGSTPTGTTT